jgi:hypothetical protein
VIKTSEMSDEMSLEDFKTGWIAVVKFLLSICSLSKCAHIVKLNVIISS